MTIGTPRKVLSEVAATIDRDESGEITLSWHTTHPRRVAEIVESAPSGEAVVTGDEPVDYVRVGGILPAPSDKPAPNEGSWEQWAGKAVGRSFADTWRTLFPPKNGRSK